MNKQIILIILLLSFFSLSLAKNRPEWKIGLSGQLMGPTVFGIYGEYQARPGVNIVIGLGSNFNFQAGFTYHMVAANPRIFWYPYFGAQFVSIQTDESRDNRADSRAFGAYFPLGLKFITKTNWVFAFELAYNYVKTDADQVNSKPWVPAIRIGKYF